MRYAKCVFVLISQFWDCCLFTQHYLVWSQRLLRWKCWVCLLFTTSTNGKLFPRYWVLPLSLKLVKYPKDPPSHVNNTSHTFKRWCEYFGWSDPCSSGYHNRFEWLLLFNNSISVSTHPLRWGTKSKKSKQKKSCPFFFWRTLSAFCVCPMNCFY